MAASIRLLTVCSGNLCRSPLAAQLLRSRLADLPQLEIASAGIVARAGEPMPDPAAALSVEFGGDPRGHSARLLDEPLLDGAALVLGMAREHRREAVTMLPRVSRRTFTLREFARLAEALGDEAFASVRAADDDEARVARLVDEVASLRGHVPPPESPDEDDVVDPYRLDETVYRESADQLVPAVESVADLLRRTLEVR